MLGQRCIRVRVGKRYVVTIPKEIREEYGIREGDELLMILVDDGVLLRKSRSLIEFIDRFGGRGSIKVLFEHRREEELVENERIEEIAGENSS